MVKGGLGRPVYHELGACECDEGGEPAPRHRFYLLTCSGLAAQRPLCERVDHEDDKYDGEEDAVDVHRRRCRSLAARWALSFPVERTYLSFCSLRLGLGVVSTHALQERRLKSLE